MGKFHFITIDEISLISKEGDVLWKRENLKNLFHLDGEEFILKALFNGGNDPNEFIPDEYYFGLDNRSTIALDDSMTSLVSEPTTFGYARQSLSSIDGFTVLEVSADVIRAQSVILIFQANGGTWGPVANLFMTDEAGSGGFLISSVATGSTFTVEDGQAVSLRMTFGLQDCA